MFKGTYNALCTVEEKEGERNGEEEVAGREGQRQVQVRYSSLSSILLHPESIMTF